ncbi:MAG TPA: MBL fold metallo-hydrolase [Pyrinomonadaceae bacterium]|nr:MBL fold metallo-hydrolase [Pyrinomonadaceae bacterium]
MVTTQHLNEIHSGLFQIELPLPIRPSGVQVYLFHNGAQSVLIDTGLGTDESVSVLHDSLREVGCNFSDIALTICTHYHPDHYGASQKIKQLTGCDVLMHKADAEYLLRSLLLNKTDYRKFLFSNGVPVNGEVSAPPALRVLKDCYLPVVPDRYIVDGEEFRFGSVSLQAISTPGHTPGHIVLYWREQRILISGDHLLPDITPHVGIHIGLEGDPLSDYLDSLRRLEGLEIEQVLPAHGRCFGEHQARIRQIFTHHKERQQTILNYLNYGPATAYELALALFDESLPDLHKEIAAYEVLAHLELMKKTNKVHVQKENEVVRYRL